MSLDGLGGLFFFLLIVIGVLLAIKILSSWFGDSDDDESDEYEDDDDESFSGTVRRRIGEELELAVGSFLERRGWTVYYSGIEKGVNDGGIDLIAKRNGVTTLIQCKFWKSYRIIYEKYIHQLFGAINTYKADHPDECVIGAFYTTARLSLEAKRAAQIHEIDVHDRYRF